ncbi:hypothetical protein [Actimicrobium sp. CCI2.3]|uniref:hypothetical protein n=1 Tax=Actimicrobium sp. CCI2.3 TaxID=3048616 RepID=UPI002AB4C623|nr:hypothetical protein [Actimicrobium sp. CCI2.3]MDY7574498.1 hypothetical protein [Actimicrobium sp. CCI2.3]MEB0023925.1 hypothetical protein [Actimicrobium sp. CCI2.3]
MSTQIAQTETAAQIANAQSQANAIGSASTFMVSKNTFVFFAGFDGRGCNRKPAQFVHLLKVVTEILICTVSAYINKLVVFFVQIF